MTFPRSFSVGALAVALFSLVVSVSADGKCNTEYYFGQMFSHSCTVILTPSGNFSVCYNDSVLLTCTTTKGPLVWDTGSMNRLFNQFDPPVMLGNLYLNVTSVEEDGNFISVTSTATLDRFALTSGGLAVECREATTDMRREVFVSSGKWNCCTCMCMKTGFRCCLAITRCIQRYNKKKLLVKLYIRVVCNPVTITVHFIIVSLKEDDV